MNRMDFWTCRPGVEDGRLHPFSTPLPGKDGESIPSRRMQGEFDIQNLAVQFALVLLRKQALE